MKERPRILIWIAAFLMAVAIGLPLQIMIAYDHWPWEVISIAAKMAPLNWVIFLLAPLAAVAVYFASPWTKGLLPALSVLVVYNNWLVVQVQGQASWLAAAGSACVFLGMMGVLATGQAGLAIANPSRRWWLVRRRFRHHVPIRIRFAERESDERERELLSSLDLVNNGIVPSTRMPEPNQRGSVSIPGEFTLSTFDLSETGAFIALSSASTARILGRMSVGVVCYVLLPLGSEGKLVIQAEIVRRQEAAGGYPAGLGIRFLDLSWMAQRKLGAYLTRLEHRKKQEPLAYGRPAHKGRSS